MFDNDLPAAVVSWSSGKDSAFALHQVRSERKCRIVGLLTTLNGENRRVAMHGVRHELLEKQLEALDLPAEMVLLPTPCDDESYRRHMERAVTKLAGHGVTRMVFGDLFLEDIRQYRIERMQGSGIEPLFPLWQRDTSRLAREMVDSGLRAVVATLDRRALPGEFIGRIYDHDFLDDLPEGVDPCGENGEFHTVVTDGPMFAAPIPVHLGATVTMGDFLYVDVIPSGGAA